MYNFKNKYLKYKSKYLELKNIKYNQFGGDLPIINDIESVNLFNDTEMEQYMNPIHGLFLCYSGYIPNIYWLNNDKLLTNIYKEKEMNLKKKRDFLNKVCKNIPGLIQPTYKLMQLKPIDYGRFIAIKYINMISTKKEKLQNNLIQNPKFFDIDDNTYKILKTYIDIVNKETFFPINNNEIFTFHVILYCLIWVSNNDNGIAEYYQGIKDIFCLLSKFPKIVVPRLELNRKENPNSFENLVLKITQKNFKILHQEWVQNFCIDSEKKLYPDCGEITALNLINLLIYNNSIFNISLLKSPIPQLNEFYTIFKNFELILDIKFTPLIFGKNLNARDAWSYIIINYANYDLKFVNICNSIDNTSIGYDLDTGLSVDKKTTNFFKLIKNLLNIENWDDLVNQNIIKINDNTINGIGEIIINDIIDNEYIIYCIPGHYYMKETQKKTDDIKFNFLTCEQQYKINLLKNSITPTIENYLYINFSSEFLVDTLNSSSEKFKEQLFILSLTDKYDSDLRRRIIIDDDTDFFNQIAKKFGNNNYLNQYTYSTKDFNFLKEIPSYEYFNYFIIKEKMDCINFPSSKVKLIGDNFMNIINYDDIKIKNIKSINLSNLSKLQSIGYNFMRLCKKLESITLHNLSELQSIGNDFLHRCISLKSIDLSSLSKLKFIGNNFMHECESLECIILPNNLQLESIENDFMNECKNLKMIDLSSLLNIKSIGKSFMSTCINLTSINLSDLSKIITIDNFFMTGCIKLSRIDLSSLINIEYIGVNFLENCKDLKNIIFSSCLKLKSIDSMFMYNCRKLESIDLSSLLNIKSIGNSFMNKCKSLESIDLSSLSNLKSIDSDFMEQCKNLESIILPTNSQLETIGNNFMNECINLKVINLSSLSNLNLIENRFMYNCTSITKIDLSNLCKIQKIDYLFMNNCKSLVSINLNNLYNLKSIEDYFLNECESLEYINLSNLNNLKSIGNNFLLACYNLKKIDLSSLKNLESIGEYFMKSCNSLESVNLSGLSNIKSIGDNFISGYTFPTITCSAKNKLLIDKVSYSLDFIII